MRDFGKRSDNSEFASIVQQRTSPISCRILERTDRILLLDVDHSELVSANFQVALKNGSECMVCELVAIGKDYVVVRYIVEPEALAQALVVIGSGLGDLV